jgi:MoaA/NifB/PqqE/SkfB family radical SAM enzyme
LAEDLFITIHLTLTEANADSIPSLLDRLAMMGARSLSLSASEPKLSQNLELAAQTAADHGLTLVWDLPVPYSAFHPVALELSAAGEEPPSGAGKAWLYVEPDGDVLPAQGINQVLGNLHNDPWSVIWEQAKNR